MGPLVCSLFKVVIYAATDVVRNVRCHFWFDRNGRAASRGDPSGPIGTFQAVVGPVEKHVEVVLLPRLENSGEGSCQCCAACHHFI